MTLSAKVAESLDENALEDALAQVKAHLKTASADKEARHLYIDLLVLAGDYERADAQCSLAATFSPDDTMGFAVLRNQLRAMAARSAWFRDAAAPDFPQGPSPLDRAAMKLGLAQRDGEARHALDALEDLRGEQPMTWNGGPVADFRDLDDRIPHALEVIMSGGAYLWIDFSRISAVRVEPISRPRDLAYRRAQLELFDGASAAVLLPAIYAGTPAEGKLLLGRETEWIDEASGITTGRGQKCFLAGDALVAFHDMTTLAAAGDAQATRHAAHG